MKAKECLDTFWIGFSFVSAFFRQWGKGKENLVGFQK